MIASTECDPISHYSGDRAWGTVLMVFAAIGIPLSVLNGIFSAPIGLTGWHTVHVGFFPFPVKSFPSFGLFATMFHLVVLAALVFAGYGITRSMKQAFILVLAVGSAAIFLHAASFLGICAVAYSLLRLTGRLGVRTA